ncbi:hypothetical protein BDP27DRAFT_1436451 [Rhodocollybia butyracea]|uniref:G domain-containing protein n=1 Tax=Rhodocollybia butyracea TaxID=206335 RepID=A0A9P5P735_9AGAR|nr:hypothetical protein BDP27DRAFT_1436451 [Rhodocollybia butyracea]
MANSSFSPTFRLASPGISPPSLSSTNTALCEWNGSIIPQGLASSMEEIPESLRILVIGKSGAGKSSLINATFDIDTANVAHEISGVSDINTEITSEHRNTRFIMHDSQGFAVGETQNYAKVQKFIADRAKKSEMNAQLHAIWFCMEIPTENGALVERVDENFLRLDLQNVPVLVVFTKYDLLVRKFEKEADDSIGDEERETMAKHQANEFYNETCVLPLKSIIHNKLVPVRVSTKKPKYADTLVKLVDETWNCLSLVDMSASAERANVDANEESRSSQTPRKISRLEKIKAEPLVEHEGQANTQADRSGDAQGWVAASLRNKDR